MTLADAVLRPALLACTLTGLLAGLSGCELSQSATGDNPVPPVAKLAVPFCLNDQCGVVDQDGKVLVPFGKAGAYTTGKFDRYVIDSGGNWNLRMLDGKVLGQYPGTIRFLGHGLFAIAEDDESYRLFTADGKPISDEIYADIFRGGADEYLVYQQNGRQGLLDLQGKPLTAPEFDSIASSNEHSLASLGGLVLAEKSGKSWLINSKTGKSWAVDFDDMDPIRDGVLLVKRQPTEAQPETLYGLINAEGKLVVPLAPRRLGQPANGLLAFHTKDDERCGYLDFQGKEVIPPRFTSCEPFGKQFAFARHPDNGKYGLIKRDGNWQGAQEWDYVYGAGYNRIGGYDDSPGLATAFKGQTVFDYAITLFDTDSGQPLTRGEGYIAMGTLGADLLTFSTKDAPAGRHGGAEDGIAVPGMGLMDRTEKVLVKSEGYAHFWADPTGTLLTAATPDGLTHVFNRQGRRLTLIAAPELQVRKDLGVFFTYDQEDGASRDSMAQRFQAIRGVYALDGRQLLMVRNLPCGAQQLLNARNEPIWPEKADSYCPL
ncbi:WG repeat-containing protein [Chitinilyticum litopenaei]|uniref:WG repeat-containing protein n=1 Tax=Chitinilyticum litopenaei TaxID=1121276 RepID=UPI0003F67D5F|nr:WG repeat-containing protein [Chitinilyticum litopenaei]